MDASHVSGCTQIEESLQMQRRGVSVTARGGDRWENAICATADLYGRHVSGQDSADGAEAAEYAYRQLKLCLIAMRH